MPLTQFHKPTLLSLDMSHQLVYPMKGTEALLGLNEESIKMHLQDLFDKNINLTECAYSIIILWNDDKTIMSDAWLFKTMENEDSGYIVDCKTFRGSNEVHEEGITASDGLILLGRECELSEEIRKSGGSISDYLNSTRDFIQ